MPMEGNGYDMEQGFGDGWGNANRRNATGQGGLYGNDTYMQGGLYDYATASYGGDMGGAQRMTAYGGNGMGASQRISASTMYGSDMGSQRMSYGYGDMQTPSTPRDMSFGGSGSFSSMDQSGRRPFDSFDGSGMQNSFKQRGDMGRSQKSGLSDYESDMAMMQGGSYAGSTPFGKNSGKRRGFEDNDYPQQGGDFSSYGQKGPGSKSYKAVAPPEVDNFGFEQKRPFGFRGFNQDSRTSMFDDNRYRLGSGGPARGNPGRGSTGRGRGRGMPRNAGGDWQDRGMKRKDQGFRGPWPKKKPAAPAGKKNPISFVNEIRPDSKFLCSDMEGPSNNPTFRVTLEFDGETYTAAAKSKKNAKRYAAEAALRAYLETPAAVQLCYTEDIIDWSQGTKAEDSILEGETVESSEKDETTASGNNTAADEAALGGKNPVMYLNELRKDVAYDLKEETGQAHNKNFIMRVTVGGEEYEGSGQSKKIARSAAAREALKGLGLLKMVTPISQDNKGYQMLQRMGWSGTGLGANEQGIKNCIEPVKY